MIKFVKDAPIFLKFKANKIVGAKDYIEILREINSSVASDFFVKSGNYVISGKSVLGWISLGIVDGDVIEVECNYFDENQIVNALVKRGFFELIDKTEGV